jgi:two-component system sensor histidine kinase PhoQ
MAVNAHSLRQRLLIVSGIVSLIFIGLTALILDQAFKQSLNTELNDRLQTQLYLLLGAAEFENEELFVPRKLDAPRFNQIDSGLFAFIGNEEGEEVWRSQSAKNYAKSILPKPASSLQPGKKQQGLLTIDEGEFFYLSLGVAWETNNKALSRYTFTIAESTARIDNTLTLYRTYLWTGLAVLAVILLLVFTLTLYWGLAPLSKLAIELKSIENGTQEKLLGHYPLELQGVTHNLNVLLEHEKRQHSRYRNTLANLAHSLKTPLAVLRGVVDSEKYQTETRTDIEIKPSENMTTLAQQVGRMDEIVQHQLQRAVHVGPQSLNQSIDVLPVVTRLSSVIKKVYRDTVSKITLSVQSTVVFRGDQGDLMEILGNLMDNAGKYGGGKIQISAENIQVNGQNRCRLMVEDNGVGIASEQISEILLRGVRADQKHQGQGIGLAMVVDIVDQYQGRLTIETSNMGGAKLVVLI